MPSSRSKPPTVGAFFCRYGFFLLFVALLATCLVLLTGCAVGFDAAGTPILGLKAGPPEPETISEIGHAIGSILPPPFGTIVGGAATGLAAIFGLNRSRRAGWAEAQANQARVDSAWEEAEKRTLLLTTPPPEAAHTVANTPIGFKSNET